MEIFAASVAHLPGQCGPLPTVYLPGGLAVAPGFVAAAKRALQIELDGAPLIDCADWPALTDAAKLARLGAGVQRLLQACAGDHGLRLRWASVLSEYLAVPSVAAFNNPEQAEHPNWYPRGSVDNFFSAEANLSMVLRRIAGYLALDLLLARQGGQGVTRTGQLSALPGPMCALAKATLALTEDGGTDWVMVEVLQFYADAGLGNAY